MAKQDLRTSADAKKGQNRKANRNHRRGLVEVEVGMALVWAQRSQLVEGLALSNVADADSLVVGVSAS